MLSLADILRQCRDIVAYHHSLTKMELISAIDIQLRELGDAVTAELTEPANRDEVTGPER